MHWIQVLTCPSGQAPDHLDKAAAFEPRQLRDRLLMVESGAPLRHMRVLLAPDLQLLYGAAQEMGTNTTCLVDTFNIAQSGS